MERRDPILPRGLWPLLVLLAAAAIWAALAGRDERRSRVGQAGAGTTLIGMTRDRVDLLAVDLADRSLELRRGPDGWAFTGGFADRIDANRATDLVRELCEAPAVPLLPGGGEFDTVGLGLSGHESVRAILGDQTGRRVELVVGLRNPVHDLCYARVAGREGAWGVAPRLRVLLLSLPNAVRLQRLWPLFDVAGADSVARHLAGAPLPDLFARDARGAWWVRAPAAGVAGEGEGFAAYARIYGDRVERRDGHVWWRARDRAVREWIFQLDDAVLSAFGLRDAPIETLRALGLRPPRASVHVALRNGDEIGADFGAPVSPGQVACLRDGRPHVLHAPQGVSQLAQRPLATFLNVDVLASGVQEADSLCVERPAGDTLLARRQGRAWSVDGRSEAVARPTPGELARDLVLSLERLEIVAPLPPTLSQEEALRPPFGYVVTVWGAGRPPAGEMAQFGLPATNGGRGEADSSAAVAWFPADGKRLLIDRQFLVSLRNLCLSIAGDGSP